MKNERKPLTGNPKNRVLRSVIISSAVLLSLEVLARSLYFGPNWYPQIEADVQERSIDFLFIGSSRVPAAIDRRVFANELQDMHFDRPIVRIPARGSSTIVQHWMGIRNFVDEYPDRMRGCKVFLELPGGLPTLRRSSHQPESVRADWLNEDLGPQFLADVLRVGDLTEFWITGTSIELKVQITFRFMMNSLRLVQDREKIRNLVKCKGVELVQEMLEVCSVGDPVDPNSKFADLAAEGGIKRDPKTIAMVQKRAKRRTAEMLVDQTPLAGWDDSPIVDIANLLKRVDGELVLYHMPQSSYYNRVCDTEMRVSDRERFRRWAEQEGVRILNPTFQTIDADFPDLLHLSKTKRPEFTKALALAWKESKRQSAGTATDPG
jgi:hypothetical protein